jgi:pimeloyl-ACP methyl ester carboxylesterase
VISRLFAAACALTLAAPSAAVIVSINAYASPGKLVALPDGRRINVRCTGSGSPTVILEAGYKAWSFAWAGVQPNLKTRVCSYDRAGMGFSDPGPEPRDGAAIVADLDAWLRASGEKPPYLLVGHSAGGLYMRLFSNLHPNDIAGMVFVDPSIERQFGLEQRIYDGAAANTRACGAAMALPADDPKRIKCVPALRTNPGPFDFATAKQQQLPGYWNTLASEFANLPATARQVMAGRQYYGALPLIVLTAGGVGPPPADPQAAQKEAQSLLIWTDAHRELAARSTIGVDRVVPDTGHLITTRKPQAIVDAIVDVTNQAKH